MRRAAPAAAAQLRAVWSDCFQLAHCSSAAGQGSSGGKAQFGHSEVDAADKQQMVGQVFSSVASSYDTMNDLMSFGLHRLWKARFISKLQVFPGMQHLDVAGGTGDVAFAVLQQMRAAEEAAVDSSESSEVTPAGCVTICDINPSMLAEGRRRAQQAGHDGQALEWVEGNAEALPFPDACMDSYSIAFGIRNVTNIGAALREAKRVLRPGGQFLCLEFSAVGIPGLRQLYDAYSFAAIPQLGRMVAGDEASYRYLVESIRHFPDQLAFADMIAAAGLQQVHHENLSGGIVAIHCAHRL